MSRINFFAFSGYVTAIQDLMIEDPEEAGCMKLFTVMDDAGLIVNFVVSPDTYVVDHESIRIGDFITGYYDGDAPAILIYPPQYSALVIVKETPNKHVKVDYFNQNLESSDGQLKLNITADVPMLLTNGQTFIQTPANRNLVVIYGPATKSIPAQTTPYRIIILCSVR